MTTLLQIDFSHDGPFGSEAAERLGDMARSIAEAPGLVWKIWTENENLKRAGGIYLFRDEASAKAYLAMHTERLQGLGITEIDAHVFDVNPELSALTRAPVP